MLRASINYRSWGSAARVRKRKNTHRVSPLTGRTRWIVWEISLVVVPPTASTNSDSIRHWHACVYSLSKLLFSRFSVLMCFLCSERLRPDDDLVSTPPTPPPPPTSFMCLSVPDWASQWWTVMKGARHIKMTRQASELRCFTGRMSQNNIFTAWVFNVGVGVGGWEPTATSNTSRVTIITQNMPDILQGQGDLFPHESY